MADITFEEEAQNQMAPGSFSLTEAQKEELRTSIDELLRDFESDRRLVDQFLQSPFRYLQRYHPISFLADMESKMPSLVFSFDSSIRRLKLELLSSSGNCLACILSALSLIYAFLLHFGLGAELLKSVVAEVVLALTDFFKVNDKVKGILETIGGLATTIAPIGLARNFCRRMGLCKKMPAVIDLDTIHSILPKQSPSGSTRAGIESLKKGGSYDL